MDAINPKAQLVAAKQLYSNGDDLSEDSKRKLEKKIKYLAIRVKINDFIVNNQIAVCVLFGMIGFIYAVCVLVLPYKKNVTPYGEIYIYNKTQLVADLLNKRLTTLSDTAKAFETKLDGWKTELAKPTPDQVKKVEATRMQAVLVQIAKILPATRKELYLLEYHNTDTSMVYFSKYLYVNKGNYLDVLRSLTWKNDTSYSEFVNGFAVDTCFLLKGSPVKYPVKLQLKQHKRSQVMSFLSDYPAFGLWMVLTIAQMMLWFLLCPVLSGNLLNLRDTLGDSYNISWQSRLVNFALPLTFVGVFCLAFYKGLADNQLVTDYYFLTHYNLRIFWYAVPGYLVTIFCFTGYLTLAKQFDNMDKEAVADPTLLSNAAFISKFQSLKSAFNNSFICSAIVLSFMILWVGNVVYAVNSIDVFRFYTQLAGQPLIPGDFVYLMGLLHTCILLTFYIPVKLKFGTLQITQPMAMADAGIPDKNLFQTLLGSLGSLLVTTSPLIASFTQNIFHIFFK